MIFFLRKKKKEERKHKTPLPLLELVTHLRLSSWLLEMGSSPFIYFCLSVLDFLFVFFFSFKFLVRKFSNPWSNPEKTLFFFFFLFYKIRQTLFCLHSFFFPGKCIFSFLHVSLIFTTWWEEANHTCLFLKQLAAHYAAVTKPSSAPSSLCLGGSGGGGSSSTGRGYCEQRVLDGFSRGGGGMKADCRCRVPCGGCSCRNQAYWVAGEQREVLRI